MIDIHTHIIPFVDDGSPSLKDSIEMIKNEISMGVDTIVCTPHHIYSKYEKSVEEIKHYFDVLLEEVKKQNLKIHLLLGQEIYYSRHENIIEMLNQNKLLTMNQSQYILLEFSFVYEPEDLLELIYNFTCFHYKVIIAHVERYEWMTIEKIIQLRKEGAFIQINANSILKLTNKREYKLVQKLLKNNLVDIVASDVHSFRPSNLLLAKEKCKNNQLFEFNFLNEKT